MDPLLVRYQTLFADLLTDKQLRLFSNTRKPLWLLELFEVETVTKNPGLIKLWKDSVERRNDVISENRKKTFKLLKAN